MEVHTFLFNLKVIWDKKIDWNKLKYRGCSNDVSINTTHIKIYSRLNLGSDFFGSTVSKRGPTCRGEWLIHSTKHYKDKWKSLYTPKKISWFGM